jgi:ATP-binding cassette, subfamily C (CFTR/MRP), member 1
MKLMADKLRGKTIISVLHRLEVALLYDRILVLENGRVAHFGTPDEVIRESGLFSSFRNTPQRLNDVEC